MSDFYSDFPDIPDIDDEHTILTGSQSGDGVTTKDLTLYNVQELDEVETLIDYPTKQPWRVALTLLEANAQVEIIFDIVDSVLLGRSYPNVSIFAGIDLSPFQAYDLGVSRKHATFFLHDNQVVIQDNESSNGTFLNNKRLKPNVNYVVQRGVLLNLGRMSLRVDFLFNPSE